MLYQSYRRYLNLSTRLARACQQETKQQQCRWYYTNADRVKSEDPYAMLGLSYGDGASLETIRSAFRKKAAQLHPDVNRTDSPNIAAKKFQALVRAYERLTQPFQAGNSQVDIEEWRIRMWRNGDRIAISRTDVAGVKKVRPIQPVGIRNHQPYQIGHPQQSSALPRRNEFIGDGNPSQPSSQPLSSSVGRGQNKWVKPKAYTPWKNERNLNSSNWHES